MIVGSPLNKTVFISGLTFMDNVLLPSSAKEIPIGTIKNIVK